MGSHPLAHTFLKQALQQPGCPICRCCVDYETRYLKFLLWEHVNDLATRLQIIRSLGFCRRHAWQMFRMEQDGWGSLLGNSIIYEDLIHTVLLRVHATRALVAEEQMKASGLRRGLRWLATWLTLQGRRLERLLVSEAPCRVCELSQKTAKHYANTLAGMLAEEPIRDLYGRSDGVCLPHLRLALQGTRASPGLDYLLAQAETRLSALRQDLREYHRKQAYQYRGEAVTEHEQAAMERALAFLNGLERPLPISEAEACETLGHDYMGR